MIAYTRMMPCSAVLTQHMHVTIIETERWMDRRRDIGLTRTALAERRAVVIYNILCDQLIFNCIHRTAPLCTMIHCSVTVLNSGERN